MNFVKASGSTIGISIVLCLSFAIAVGGSPKAQGRPPTKGIQTIIEVRPWHVREILAPRVIEIGMTVGTCDGLREPTVLKAHIAERQTAATIVVWVRREEAYSCLGEERFVGARIKLKRPLGHRKLKDGSTSPPSRRWPE